MARAKTDTALRSGQLNVRIDDEHAEMLDAYAFLYAVSPPEFIRQLLNRELVRLRADRLFNDAVRLQREARAIQRGEVVPLPQGKDAS